MPDSREPTPRRGLWRRHPWVVGVAVLATVLAAVVGAAGGLARSTPDDVRSVAPGTEVDATPLRVTLERAEATYEAAGRVAEPGRAYVVVHGTVALTDRESVGSELVHDTFGAELRAYEFGDPVDDPAPEVTVAGDGSTLLGLGPGLTYEVVLVYEVDEAAVPAVLAVSLRRHVRRPSSLNVSEIGWHDPTTFAQVRFEVAPLPEHRPEDPL